MLAFWLAIEVFFSVIGRPQQYAEHKRDPSYLFAATKVSEEHFE